MLNFSLDFSLFLIKRKNTSLQKKIQSLREKIQIKINFYINVALNGDLKCTSF